MDPPDESNQTAPPPGPRMASATVLRLVYVFIQGVSSVALFAALAAVQPRDDFAALAVAQGVLVIAQAIGDFGLSQAAVTALAAALARDPKDAKHASGGAAFCFLAGSVAAAMLVVLVAPLLPGGVASVTVCIAPAAAAAVLVAGADGLLRAHGDIRSPLLIMAASRLAAFICLPVAAAGGSPEAVALALSAGSIAGALPALAVLLRFARVRVRAWIRWFAYATVPLGVSQLLVVASARINTVLLSATGQVRAAAAFESGWRMYQLAQYIGGGVSSGVAPLLAVRMVRDGSAARTTVLRLLAGLAGVGVLAALALIAARGLFAKLFFPEVADVILVLAVATPSGMCALLAAVVLSGSDRWRGRIPTAFAAGAVVNAAGMLLTVTTGSGALGAAAACGAGVIVTSGVLLHDVFGLLADLDKQALQPAPEGAEQVGIDSPATAG